MGSIRRYTDKDYTVRMKGFNFNDASEIIVSIEQNGESVFETRDVTIIGTDSFTFHISQEQSGSFTAGVCAGLYVDWVVDGKRDGVGPLDIDILPNYPKGVVA